MLDKLDLFVVDYNKLFIDHAQANALFNFLGLSMEVPVENFYKMASKNRMDLDKSRKLVLTDDQNLLIEKNARFDLQKKLLDCCSYDKVNG